MPHFHARYAGRMVSIDIDELTVLGGQMSPRALSLVLEWAAQHQAELRKVWAQAAAAAGPLDSIEPLR